MFGPAAGLLALLAGQPAQQDLADLREEEPVKVFVLAGQSNMQGLGAVHAKSDSDNKGQGSLEYLVQQEPERFGRFGGHDGAWVVRDDVSIWLVPEERQHRKGALTVGFGANRRSIGPEFACGHALGEHYDAHVLLIKVAWGGKSLAKDFRPPSAGGEVGDAYRGLVDSVQLVLADLGAQMPELAGREHELVGFGWHQGWNDGCNWPDTRAYEQNLAHFIGDVRAAFGVPDLPFVIAGSGFGGRQQTVDRRLAIQAAQTAVAQRAEFRSSVRYVETRDYFRSRAVSPSGQRYHWNHNAETLVLIGDALAAAMIELAEPEPALPAFVAETIDEIEIGYGLAIGDVDGDQRPDILLADKRRFVWYRNPDWKRFVLTENLTERDNVCIAARDIDGDGRVEVAVGANWGPGDTEHSGSLHYLDPPADRTQLWTPVELPHEPVVHRMRWVRVAAERFDLVVSPLHGRGNVNGQGVGARLLAYEKPEDVRAPWRTVLLDDTLHLAHNFDRGPWNPETAAEEVLYIGREGALLVAYEAGAWQARKLAGLDGGGEIRMGRHADGTRFIATIAPFHGNRLAIHRLQGTSTRTFARTILDEGLRGGHAIAVADLLGDGGHEVVAGWREPNAEGEVGIKLFRSAGPTQDVWSSIWIDRNGMATEDIRIADLDGDGRADIVAAGRSSKNLKVYWNRAEK